MNIYAILTDRIIGSLVIFSAMDYGESQNEDDEKCVCESAFDFSKTEKSNVILFYRKMLEYSDELSSISFSDGSVIEKKGDFLTLGTPLSSQYFNIAGGPECFRESFGDIVQILYDMSDEDVLTYNP